MRRGSFAVAAGVLAAVGLTGCAAELPRDPDWTGRGCAGTATDMVIHGSLTDPRVTWVTGPNGPERREIIWPVGYSARFAPTLEILDEQGLVVAREGDRLQGWCYTVDMPMGVPIRVDDRNVVRATPAT